MYIFTLRQVELENMEWLAGKEKKKLRFQTKFVIPWPIFFTPHLQ